MFIKSLMFVCYDFINIKLNSIVSYIGSIGWAPLPHPIPFTPRHPIYLNTIIAESLNSSWKCQIMLKVSNSPI